jgi:hypothetical protein
MLADRRTMCHKRGGVYHFSPPYNHTPPILDGVGYKAGKSDTPLSLI